MKKFLLTFVKKYTIILILLVLMGVFSATNPAFLSVRNITNIIIQNTYFIIAAVGLSFVMIGGGIDLSVGWQMSLVGVVVSILLLVYNLPVWAAICLGLLMGMLLGFINGFVVTNVKVFPLIVTIASGTVFQGVSYILFQGRTFKPFPDAFRFLTQGRVIGIPFDVFLTIIIVLFAIFVYYKTSFGWNVLALGGNEEASRLAGIRTKVIKVAVYTICGFFMAIATMIMMSKANSHSTTMGPGTEFTCLTAAIIGGISFMGGEGNMVGLVTGVFVLAVLGNGMQLAGWGTYYQYIVKGLILLGAVTFDELQKMGKRKQRLTGEKIVPQN
jgi:ribose transport system permease protein